MRETMDMITQNYPKQSMDCLMNIIGTHDTMRILTALGSEEFADESKKDVLAAARLSETEKAAGVFLLKAAVLMQMTLPGIPCIYYGDEAGMEGYSDPFNRRFFPWEDIDAGIHDFYKKICKIRSDNREIFADGEYKLVHEQDGVFYYKRVGRDALGAPLEISVCVNLSDNIYNLQAESTSLLTGVKTTEISAKSFDIF